MYLPIFTNMYDDMVENTKSLKEKAIEEYKQALLMPRKKKKIAKKSALLLYSIAVHGEKLLK